MNDSLEPRIEQVEHRLIARQLQLRHHWQALGQRVQRATEPRRQLVPMVAAVLSLLAAGWLLRRLGARPAGPPAPQAAGAAGTGWRLFDPSAWICGAVWLWPLLPAAWRARGPGTASLFVALGLPLVERLFRRRAPH